jgi:hypothetical protein
MAITPPLDFYNIFVENFAGSGIYFFFLALIAIVFFAARFRMTGIALGMMVVLFATMFAGFAYPIYALIILIAAFIIYLIFSRMWK